MERIKAALEKVRETRAETQAVVKPAETPTARVRQLPPNLRKSPSGPKPAPEKIAYQTTRIVNVDPATLEANRIVAHTKSDQRSAHFDMLRTQITQAMQRNGWRTLAITSPRPACGKTVISINLAYSLAHKTSETVLLVDFDLRKPMIASYLGLPEGPGLVDYLEGRESLANVLVNPGQPRLVVLPNTKSIVNAAETLGSDATGRMIEEMRQRYEHRTVIFDLPPLLTVDDALAFAPHIDCFLLIAVAGQTNASDLKECKRLLDDKNLIGIVLNKSDAQRVDYY